MCRANLSRLIATEKELALLEQASRKDERSLSNWARREIPDHILSKPARFTFLPSFSLDQQHAALR
jgi:hypothetical protein